jgi:hypothetical protein
MKNLRYAVYTDPVVKFSTLICGTVDKYDHFKYKSLILKNYENNNHFMNYIFNDKNITNNLLESLTKDKDGKVSKVLYILVEDLDYLFNDTTTEEEAKLYFMLNYN